MIEDIVVNKGTFMTASTAPVNHVFAIDCSGSMYSSLPEVRKHLKNSIGLSAKENDTFTAIWFSGKGQAGVIFETVSVTDLLSMAAVHQSIDRFVKPVGLTAFADPLEIAEALNLPSGNINNLVMMTDGYNNQSSVESIFAVLARLPVKYHSISFVEYGYYADREMLAKMAANVGGNHLFADRMENYSKVVDSTISSVPRAKNIDVRVNKAAKNAIYVHNDQIRIVPVKIVDGFGSVSVPEDVDKIHSIVPKDVLSKQLSADRLYLIMYYAAKEGLDDLVWNCLMRTGDVRLIDLYQNAFTKQELSEFEEAVQECVLDEAKRNLEGKDSTRVPDANAYTVYDLLRDLVEADARLVTNSPYWEYKRTTRASEAQETLPRFIPYPLDALPMRNIVMNSERPNVSIQVQAPGIVEIPENKFGLGKIPSKITRNYTLIRDGIKNVDFLPVMMNTEAFNLIKDSCDCEVISSGEETYAVFNLSKIPVINRKGLESVSLEDISNREGDIQRLSTKQKVLKYLIDKDSKGTVGAKSTKLASMYGEEAASWLSEIGVRDYGFSPVGTIQAEASDEYPSIQVKVKVKGFSSIPTISKVVEKQEGINADIKKSGSSRKKLNMVESLVMEYVSAYQGLGVDELNIRLDEVVSTLRQTRTHRAQAVAALILGRKWFGDEEVVALDKIPVTSDIETTGTIEKLRVMVKI